MSFATATLEVIAAAVAAEIGREVDYRPVEADGAARAAGLIAECSSRSVPAHRSMECAA